MQFGTVIRRRFGGWKINPINKGKVKIGGKIKACCLAIAPLACSSALNMGKLSLSETSVTFYQTTWRNIPKDTTRYVNLFIFMKTGMKVMTMLACESLYVRLNIVNTNMAALQKFDTESMYHAVQGFEI
jgi:hypothetical protein